MAENEFRGNADEKSGAMTSSGVTVAGISVGGATDRKQPDRTIRATATGEKTHVTGDGLPDDELEMEALYGEGVSRR
jgi:hypothetical protein